MTVVFLTFLVLAQGGGGVGYFGPIFPDGQGDRRNYCVPMHRTTQISTHFPTKNARLLSKLSKSAVFTLWTHASPVVGCFKMVRGKLTQYWALCRNAPVSRMVWQRSADDPQQSMECSSHWLTTHIPLFDHQHSSVTHQTPTD